MKLLLTVSTAKGFYAHAEVSAPTLKRGWEKIIQALEAMPKELDGEKQIDWNKMVIEVTREN